MKKVQSGGMHIIKFIGVVILFSVGILIGIQFEKRTTKTEEVYSLTVAIVNSDQGVIVEGEQINYASRILNTLSSCYVMSGIQDAQEGVQSGKYAAYVIIPSDFSEHVVSLNTVPEQVSIEYELSNRVTKDCKVKALEEVETLNSILNNGMSYMYISGILSEFHSVQDGAGTIMENDQRDTDVILGINATDLTQLITIPELKTTETCVAPLDVQQYIDKDKSLVEDINNQYVYYISLSRSDWENLKNRGDSIVNDWIQMENDINEFAISEDEDGNLIYEEGIQNILGLVSRNDSSLNSQQRSISGTFRLREQQLDKLIREYNDNLESKKVQAVNDIKDAYAVNDIEVGSSPYSLEVNGAEIPYYTGDTVTIQAAGNYVNQVDNLIHNATDLNTLKEEYEIYINNNTTSWNDNPNRNYLESLKALSTNNDLVDNQTLVNTINSNLSQPDIAQILGNEISQFDDTLTSTTICDDDESNLSVSLRQVLGKDGQSVKLSGIGEEEVMNILQDNFINVVENKSEIEKTKLMDKYGEEKKNMENYLEANEKFDPYQYIDQQVINNYFLDLNQNGTELQRKINDDYSQNMNYVSDITMNASENMSSVMEAVTNANQISQDNMNQGLDNVKQLKSETYATNKELLQDFTTKLPYTRLGELEYIKAYEFIANPTELSEMNREGTQNNEKKKDAKLWIYVAGAIVFCIVFYFCVRMLKAMWRSSDNKLNNQEFIS